MLASLSGRLLNCKWLKIFDLLITVTGFSFVVSTGFDFSLGVVSFIGSRWTKNCYGYCYAIAAILVQLNVGVSVRRGFFPDGIAHPVCGSNTC